MSASRLNIASTKEDIDGGWLSGPYDPAELRRLLGPLYVTSDSLVNSCFGTSEAVDLGGVDEYAVLARTLLEMLKDDRSATVSLICGTVRAGVLHASLSLSEARTLSGRTIDRHSVVQFSLNQLCGRLPAAGLSCRGDQSAADAGRLFRLIGWWFSIKPEKRIPFAPREPGAPY
jgi:hypothetical protein